MTRRAPDDHRTCPECGRTIVESPPTEGCGACERALQAITEIFEEMVDAGYLEHAGVDQFGLVVYRRTTKRGPDTPEE